MPSSSPSQLVAPPDTHAAAPGHSTGPRTPAGLAISSQNARTHGCCSQLLLQPGEDPARWEELKASWISEYQSLNSPAAIPLAIRAAEAQWALFRVRHAFDHVQYEISLEQPDFCLWTEQHHRRFARFQRYYTAADRAFHRAFLDIERLRTAYLKERRLTCNEAMDRAKQALRQRKADLQAALIQARIDVCISRKSLPLRKATRLAGSPEPCYQPQPDFVAVT
jgi:hypothetical protein